MHVFTNIFYLPYQMDLTLFVQTIRFDWFDFVSSPTLGKNDFGSLVFHGALGAIWSHRGGLLACEPNKSVAFVSVFAGFDVCTAAQPLQTV